MKKLLTMIAGIIALNSCGTNSSKAENDMKSNEKNDVIDCIMTRTSIRNYTEKTISNDTIETLLRAGMAAPTAVNKQPWHFVAVTNSDKLEGLAIANPNAGMARKAPLAIVVCGDMNKALEGEARAFWIQDCSAATENILLAAHAMGLGAVWTGLYPNGERVKAVAELLKLPETIIPLCAIVIGYPDEQPAPKDKWLPENVSFNEFGVSQE